jgi:hypothetical protein
MTDNNPVSPPAVTFEHTANFVSSYANSTIFESTAWDLKITFGQVEQVSGQAVVKQHLAVSIPWAQAKLALYWLRVHVEAMEIQSGKVPIRKDVIPPEPPPLSPEDANDPESKRIYEFVQKLREEFIASL